VWVVILGQGSIVPSFEIKKAWTEQEKWERVRDDHQTQKGGKDAKRLPQSPRKVWGLRSEQRGCEARLDIQE